MNTQSITPTEADEQLQHALLTLIVTSYPAHWAVSELIRELTSDPDAFQERDLVERAVRDLARAGLAHRHGSFVFATRAAVIADRLTATA